MASSECDIQKDEIQWSHIAKTMWTSICLVLRWLMCLIKFLNPIRHMSERDGGVYGQTVATSLQKKVAALTSWLRRSAQNETTSPPLHDWVQHHLSNMGIHVTNFDSDWVDGIALCALVESLCPGAFPKYDHLKPTLRLNNCRLALKLVQKHLVTTSVISPEEVADGNNEMKMLRLLNLIRTSCSMRRANQSLRSADMSQTTAKGRGLVAGLVGKIAKFNILFPFDDTPQITIEIIGPNGEYHLETISQVQFARSYQNAKCVERQESIATNEEIITKVQFEYHKVSDGQIEVNYIPKSVGKYTVNIKWNGVKVKGSPFTVAIAESIDALNQTTKCKFSRRVVEDPNYRKPILQRLLSQSKLDVESVKISQNDEDLEKATAVLRRTSTVSRSISRADTGAQMPLQKPRGTIKRKRVLRKIVTSDGKEIVIQDTSTPSISSQDSEEKKDKIVDAVSKTMGPSMNPPLRHMNAIVGAQMQTYDIFADQLGEAILRDAFAVIKRNLNMVRLDSRRRLLQNKTHSLSLQMNRKRSIPGGKKRISSTSDVESPSPNQTKSSPLALERMTHSKADNGEIHKESNANSEAIQPGVFTENSHFLHISSVPSNEDNISQTDNHDIPSSATLDFPDRSTYSSHQTGIDAEHDSIHRRCTSPDTRLFFNSAKGVYEAYDNEGQTPRVMYDTFDGEVKGHGSSNMHASNDDEVKGHFSSIITAEVRSAFASPSLSINNDNTHRVIAKEDKATQVRYDEIKAETGWCSGAIYLKQRKMIKASDVDQMMISPVGTTGKLFRSEIRLDVCKNQDISALVSSNQQMDKTQKHTTIKSNEVKTTDSKRPAESTKTKPPNNGHKPIRRVPYRGKISLDPRLISSDPNLKVLDKIMTVWNSLQSSSESDTLGKAKQKFKRASHKSKQKIKRVRFSKKMMIYRRSRSSSRGSMSRSKDSSNSIEGKIVAERKDDVPLFPLTKYPVRDTVADPVVPSFFSGSRSRFASLSSVVAMAGDEVESITSDDQASSIHDDAMMKPIAEEQNEELPHFGVEDGTRDSLLSELSGFRRLSLPVINTRPSLKDLSESWHFTTITGGSITGGSGSSLLHDLSGNTINSLSMEPSRQNQLTEGQVFTFDEEDVRSYTLESLDRSSMDQGTRLDSFNQPMTPALYDTAAPFSAPPAIDTSVEHSDNLFEEIDEAFANGDHFDPSVGNNLQFNDMQNGDILHHMNGETNGDINGYKLDESDNSNENESAKIDVPKPGLCYAFGAGLHYGQVNSKNNFQVRTKGAGNGCLTVSITGPRPYTVTETTVTYTGDDLYEIIYEVTQPGFYIVNIKWSDATIPDSPYICKVTL